MYTLCPLPNTEHLRGPTKTQLTTHERNCTAKNRMEPALPPPSSYNTHTFHALMVCCTEGETSNCVIAALRAIDQHQHHVGKRYPGCQRAVRSDCSTKKRGSGCVGKKTRWRTTVCLYTSATHAPQAPCTVSRPVQCVLYFRLRLLFPTDKPYKLVAGQIVLDTQALFKNSLDGIEFSQRDYLRADEKNGSSSSHSTARTSKSRHH